MSHFAYIDENDVVTNVLVIEQEVINTGAFGNPSQWIKTSYNTSGGIHYGDDNKPDGGVPLRKNYAGVGYFYDRVRDAFIPPKIFASWVLDENTCLWVAPVPYPNDGKKYIWDEETQSWVQINV